MKLRKDFDLIFAQSLKAQEDHLFIKLFVLLGVVLPASLEQ